MQKFSLIFLSLLTSIIYSLYSVSPAQAASPENDYYLVDFFNLYKHVPPPYLGLYENEDKNRLNLPQRVVSDGRFYDACTLSSQCQGEVVIETEVAPDNWVASTEFDTGNCVILEGATTGTCDYRDRPSNKVEVSSIDYSKTEDLAYPKLQNSSDRYWNVGGTSNMLSWGSHNLSLSTREHAYRKAIVLAQAWQTMDTSSRTDNWPLGGVNYEVQIPPAPIEYDPANPLCLPEDASPAASTEPTLLEVWNELGTTPEGVAIKKNGLILLELWKQMIKPPPEEMTPQEQAEYDKAQLTYAAAKIAIDTALTETSSKTTPPKWLEHFDRTPECGPGYDKGYVLASVCVLGLCTPIIESPTSYFPGSSSSRKQLTYSDTRARQNLCSSVYDVYQKYPLKQAETVIRKARTLNPLFHYSLLSDETAIPANINKQLEGNSDSPLSSFAGFSIEWFHALLDGWRYNATNFWYTKYGYEIQGGLDKREADAIQSVGTLGTIIQSITAAAQTLVDTFFQILRHTVVIPPPAAQSIDALEDASYRTYDTKSNLDKAASTVDRYSNVVGGADEKLIAGNKHAPTTSQRKFALFPCASAFFSVFDKTSVKDYIGGIRTGCTTETPNSGVCDTSVPEQTVNGLDKVAAEELADAWYQGCTTPSEFKPCNNDVIFRAQKAKVDPIFALAIWIHESAASNYVCGHAYKPGSKIEDFGIHGLATVPPENFSAQLDHFLTLPGKYAGCGKTLRQFISMYWFGHCEIPSNTQEAAQIDQYVADLNLIYGRITHGTVSVPNWPQ